MMVSLSITRHIVKLFEEFSLKKLFDEWLKEDLTCIKKYLCYLIGSATEDPAGNATAEILAGSFRENV